MKTEVRLNKDQITAWLKKVCGVEACTRIMEQVTTTGRAQCQHKDGRQFGLVYNASNREFIVQW